MNRQSLNIYLTRTNHQFATTNHTWTPYEPWTDKYKQEITHPCPLSSNHEQTTFHHDLTINAPWLNHLVIRNSPIPPRGNCWALVRPLNLTVLRRWTCSEPQWSDGGRLATDEWWWLSGVDGMIHGWWLMNGWIALVLMLVNLVGEWFMSYFFSHFSIALRDGSRADGWWMVDEQLITILTG